MFGPQAQDEDHVAQGHHRRPFAGSVLRERPLGDGKEVTPKVWLTEREPEKGWWWHQRQIEVAGGRCAFSNA